MKSHISKQARAFFCEMCGLKFDKRHLLNRHVKIKHTVKERRYKCSNKDCDKGELEMVTWFGRDKIVFTRNLD